MVCSICTSTNLLIMCTGLWPQTFWYTPCTEAGWTGCWILLHLWQWASIPVHLRAAGKFRSTKTKYCHLQQRGMANEVWKKGYGRGFSPATPQYLPPKAIGSHCLMVGPALQVHSECAAAVCCLYKQLHRSQHWWAELLMQLLNEYLLWARDSSDVI